MMRMKGFLRAILLARLILASGIFLAVGVPAWCQAPTQSMVVFWEDGFPAADSAQPSRAQLSAILPNADFISADGLEEALSANQTQLLILPFGSAFPEEHWEAIHKYLERGGDLLVLGGRPFTRGAYKDKGTWHLRPPIQAYARTLFLNDYQETPGSDALKFTPNEDFQFLRLPEFAWKRAWGATVRLTDADLYKREGSAGTLDTRLDSFVWGVANGRKLAAPVIELDHVQNQFAGGRWIFVNCELRDGFYASPTAKNLVATLAQRAANGAEEFTVQPSWPLFLPGEPLTFNLHWQRFGAALRSTIPITGQAMGTSARIELDCEPESGNRTTETIQVAPASFPFTSQITLPASSGKGLHSVIARLYVNGEVREVYRTGFWLRDESLLKSGPRIGIASDYFTLDGKPVLVAGTTYMASDAQRQFFMRPNPWLWDCDMAEIHAAGLNMLRTGWWTAWDQVMKQSGVIHEESLRAMEAYLMTARHNGLAVQFTFFAFMPEVLGGGNPYLDPESVRLQKELILPFVERFRDVPYLAWDLINEPSFSNPQRTWQTRPNGDANESAGWNAWLNRHYPDRGAMAEAWRSALVPPGSPVPLPAEAEFSNRAQYEAWPFNTSLRAMDYEHFAQDAFRDWVAEIAGAIRAAGSNQLVTVGQDEGGGGDRPSPAFFGDTVDFTTTHTWWLSDALLWDSLVAKIPGKPMLVQETGVSHEMRVDAGPHRSLEEETTLLERKLAMAAGTSAGVIQWLWNVNSLQRDDREATIGAVRPDGTEKPEAELLRRFAQFAAAAGPHMSGAQMPEVAIVTSQTMQFSPLQVLATEAQQKSVRAIHYYVHVPAFVLTENQVAKSVDSLKHVRLAILPAPQAFSDEAWRALLDFVDGGGTLLVTGSVERDAHWRVTQRLAALGAAAAPKSILLRNSEQQVGNEKNDRPIDLSFSFDKQQSVEFSEFTNGETFQILPHGKGKVIVVSEPVELADGLQPAADVYTWVMEHSGIHSPFEGHAPAGVLIRPIYLADTVLYLLVSESATEDEVSINDRLTGGEIRAKLAPGRAELILINKSGGKVIARFGE
ncbi:MAG TPA: hypothetical protein VN774_09030 [Candidatus Limnocylindrales bacterium]|nr:hypothetical protein [Candidatus Limnocylindrales bacterium]